MRGLFSFLYYRNIHQLQTVMFVEVFVLFLVRSAAVARNQVQEMISQTSFMLWNVPAVMKMAWWNVLTVTSDREVVSRSRITSHIVCKLHRCTRQGLGGCSLSRLSRKFAIFSQNKCHFQANLHYIMSNSAVASPTPYWR